MIVECCVCHSNVNVEGLGRKPYRIPVVKVFDTLQERKNVKAAAAELGCSPGHIYEILRINGKKASDFGVVNNNDKVTKAN